MINVSLIKDDDPFEFEVVIRDHGSETRHRVTMAKSHYQQLTDDKIAPSDCTAAAFRFLLDREPKESILRSFDINVISRYFPDFERELPRYLQTP